MIRPPASLTRQQPSELCHVTIQAARRRVDLALPAATPILEFTPILATLCQVTAGPRREITPPAWTLARPAGEAFELTSTLASEGVLDGEVLHLVDAAVWRAPSVSDLADAVTGALEGGRRWTEAATAWFCAGASVATLLLVAALAVGTGVVDRSSGALALVAAGGLLVVALFVPALAARRPARLALAVGAVVLAGLGGWGLGGASAPGGLIGASLALAAALLAVSPVLPAVGPGGALAAGALTLAFAAEARGAGAAQAAAVLAAAGVIGVRVWPAVVGRGPGTFVSEPSAAAAEAAARRSRRLLASLSGGTAVVLVLAAAVLLGSGIPWAIGLAGSVAAALLLRAQAYRFLPDVLPPALAGAAVALALEWALATTLAGQGRAQLAVALPAATAAVLAGLAAVRSWLTPPLPGTRLAWLLVDLSLAPLTLGTLGVFGLIAQLVHHFVR
jgi:WXG100 protein secretion system (Wss), protein YukD